MVISIHKKMSFAATIECSLLEMTCVAICHLEGSTDKRALGYLRKEHTLHGLSAEKPTDASQAGM